MLAKYSNPRVPSMFVFLSKLIPPFFYPVGLSCLLLGLSLFFWWKRPKLAAGLVMTTFWILLVFSSPWVSGAIIRSLEQQNLPAEIPQADAIVILGGGLYSRVAPRPWIEVNDAGDRILYGAKLYREGKAPRVIVSGGTIAWREGTAPESEAMAELLTMMGVPKSVILEDSSSLNTYQNAVNVKQILDAQGIRRVLLVTSAFHMPRSLMIFRKLGMDVVPAPTDFLVPDMTSGQLSFAGILVRCVPDSQDLYNVTRALKEYVGIAVYRLKGWA
jgi:uncharacterized SAM-binding protein YcdF (DUF218 family)